MTKYFHIVQVHPVENGEPNTHKVVDELEFGTRVEANDWLEFFNHNPVADRHGCKTVAVYTGRVNDETGELTEEK